MKSSLKNMFVVLFSITAISALLVGLVNNLTKGVIASTEAANKDMAKLEVLPTFEGEAEFELSTKKIGDFDINVTKVVNKSDNTLVGYAVEAPSITKSGYADRIYLMVGFVEQEGETLIHGVKVLSQKETPGLGANMTKADNALERSIKAEPNPAKMVFKVKKDDASGSFDSLTGSTISSRAYVNAVEKTTETCHYHQVKGIAFYGARKLDFGCVGTHNAWYYTPQGDFGQAQNGIDN